MLSQPYFYLYVISCVLVFALGNTTKKADLIEPQTLAIMGVVGLITNISNYVLLVLCLFLADHWWYAIVMWIVGFIATILLPPTKEQTLAYIGVVAAPICTLLAFISLF